METCKSQFGPGLERPYIHALWCHIACCLTAVALPLAGLPSRYGTAPAGLQPVPRSPQLLPGHRPSQTARSSLLRPPHLQGRTEGGPPQWGPEPEPEPELEPSPKMEPGPVIAPQPVAAADALRAAAAAAEQEQAPVQAPVQAWPA